ncbi:MAG: hypothetical protein K8L97_06050 [Anaerolineae bacterium]|nr:hypothetical protein [Anaerolineae bacterium]
MEIKIKLGVVIVKDEETGAAFQVKTLRSAEEIAHEVEENEKEIIRERVEAVVCEAYRQE